MAVKCRIKYKDGRESFRTLRAGKTADDAHYMIMRGYMNDVILEADVIVDGEIVESVRPIKYYSK